MSVIFSSNLTINTQAGDVANRPRILYDNVFQQGTVTASSEVGADDGWLENAVDGGTYDWWEWTTNPAWLEVTLSTAQPVDMCAIGLHTGLTFVYQYYNGSAWVNLHDAVTTSSTAVYAVIFNEVSASKYRIYISAADDEKILGIAMLGKSIQLPKTFYGGHAPIVLNRTTQIVRNKTEAGFDAGVYSLRTGAATSVEISNIKPSWIRENLEDLNKKLEICPFVFAWRPSTYPNDVAYCWLNSPIRANNSGPKDYMTMQFDVQAFVGGGIVAPVIERLLINNSSSPYLALYEDNETNLSVAAAPSGLSITGDAIYVDAHPRGIVAGTFETSGTFVYEYANDTFTAIDGPTNNYATGVSIHSDQAKWLAVTDKLTAQNDANLKIFKRVTKPDLTNAYYLDSEPAISGRYVVQFSPDGEMIAVGDISNSKIAEFDATTGTLSNPTTIASATGFAWSNDSVYLATTANNLSIYKRSLIDNSFTTLTVNAPTISQPNFVGYDRLAWHPDGDIIVIGALDSHVYVLQNNGSDVFNDVTSTLIASQPSTLGSNGIHAATWAPNGSRLYLGSYISGANNVCVYDYVGGVLTKLYEGNIGGGSNSVGGMSAVRLSGTLSTIKPAIAVQVVVYNSNGDVVTLANAEGTYTIRPTVTPAPNVGVVTSSVRFYVDDVLIATDTTSPFETDIEIVLADDLTTKVLKVEVFDLYGDMTEATFDLEVNFTPWSILNLSPEVWLDASDSATISLSGSNVTTWNDKSGNVRHASSVVAPTISAASLNSLDTITFNNNEMNTPSFSNPSGADGVTVYMVAKNSVYDVSFPIPLIKGAVNSQWSYVWPSSSGLSIFRNIGGVEVSTTTVIGTSWHIFGGLIANAGRSHRLDGTEEGTGGAATISFGSSSVMTIGRGPGGGNQVNGSIAEIAVFNKTLSLAERQQIEGYLAHKWGLEANLPVDHPYKAGPP